MKIKKSRQRIMFEATLKKCPWLWAVSHHWCVSEKRILVLPVTPEILLSQQRNVNWSEESHELWIYVTSEQWGHQHIIPLPRYHFSSPKKFSMAGRILEACYPGVCNVQQIILHPKSGAGTVFVYKAPDDGQSNMDMCAQVTA